MKKSLAFILFLFLGSFATVNPIIPRAVAEVTGSEVTTSQKESPSPANSDINIVAWAKSVQKSKYGAVSKANGIKYYHGKYVENPKGTCALSFDFPHHISFGFSDDKQDRVPAYIDFSLREFKTIKSKKVGNKIEFRQNYFTGSSSKKYYLSVDLDESGNVTKVFGSDGTVQGTCVFPEIPVS